MIHAGSIREQCRWASILLMISLTSTGLPGQSSSAISDQTALSLASQSIAALTGGQAIQDVSLSGTVSTDSAESQSGNATLLALGPGESRMDLAFPEGTRSEVRDAQTGVPLGQWANADGSSGYFVNHNCWTDAVWFFPSLGSLRASPNVVLLYIGSEQRNGLQVQHIRSYVAQPTSAVFPSPQDLSTMDFYLDAASLLPTAVTYNIHPDDDARQNLAVEVDFLAYQPISGVEVPAHIQRYLQGHLQFDVTVTGASFNSGLQMSSFSVN